MVEGIRTTPKIVAGKRIKGILDMAATLKQASVADDVILTIVLQQLDLVLE